MKYKVGFGFLLSISLCVSGQITRDRTRSRIPSLSEILRDTGTLESAVVDLTATSNGFGGSVGGFDWIGVPMGDFGAPQTDFANDGLTNHGASSPDSASHGHAHGSDIHHGNVPSISPTSLTDVQGKAPPPPKGMHVDLPFEHGNMNNFPVIHHGEAPIQASPATDPSLENHISHEGQHTPGESLHGPKHALPIPMESAHGPNIISANPENIDQSSNPFHATNVHHITTDTRPSTRNFDDLAAMRNDGPGFIGDVPQPSLLELTPVAPISAHDHVNQNIMVSKTDGFMSPGDSFVSTPGDLPGDIPKLAAPNDHNSVNVHVDLPGEHGVPVDGVPVIHREANGLGTRSGTPTGNVHVDMPGEHGNPVDSHPVIHRENIGNVHVDMPGEHGNPVDSHPVIHRENIGNVHVDMPGEHGNPVDSHPVIHRENIGNVHVDMPGEHGNPIDGHPVVHRVSPAVQAGSSIFGAHPTVPAGNLQADISAANSLLSSHRDGGVVTGKLDGHRNHVDISGIHIDAPGEHGNMLNEPALHLPPGATVQDAIDAGVIPDPFGPETSETSVETAKVGHQPGTSGGNVHVDLPGQHGNPPDGHPVIHREGPNALVLHGGTSLVTSNTGLPVGSPTSNTHVDMPGEHGNPLDSHPVVHKEGQHAIHIDAPGEHGNMLNEHALHLPPGATVQDAIAAGVIPDPSAPLPGSVTPLEIVNVGHVSGVPIGNVHVDMPGQHGNPINSHPVIHREGPAAHGPHTGTTLVTGHTGLPVGAPVSNVHIDMPGEHGNPLNSHPVVHKETTHGFVRGAPVGTLGFGPETGSKTRNVHVDMPGQHWNPLDVHPVVHREGRQVVGHHDSPFTPNTIDRNHGIPLGSVHVDMPGEHGNPIDSHAVIHRENHRHGPGGGKLLGNVHIDMPGEHGVPVDGVPTVHRDVPMFAPVVKTGVLPGTLNVPVRPKHSGSNVLIKKDSRKGLGVVHGYPDARLSDLERTNFGVVDDGSVLLTNNWRRRNNRRRGGRRGRGRGGRRGRKRTTTTTTTTTTQAPQKPGGGITIIRTSRPNPLAALGNALRSALNINNNSGGGGLLGSLFRSAAGGRQGPVMIQPVRGGLFGGLFRGKR